MNRLTASLALPALLSLAGCTQKPEPTAAAPAQEARPAAPTPTPAAAPVAAQPAPRPAGPVGTIRGQVVLAGEVAPSEAPDMSSDPVCARSGGESRDVVVEGGRLANVLVRLTGKVPSGAPVPTTPVVVNQQGCTFRPRVQGAMAGQPVQVRNADGTLHNVHSYAGARTLFDRAQPPGAGPLDATLPEGVDVVKLKCDIHPWMLGWVVVVPHPYFATTGTDGTFELKDVPAGTYTLEAWHERFGTRKAQVTVDPERPAELRLTFRATVKR